MMIIHSYDGRIIRRGLKLPLCSSNAMHVGIHYEGLATDDPGTGEPSWTKQAFQDEVHLPGNWRRTYYSVVVWSLS